MLVTSFASRIACDAPGYRSVAVDAAMTLETSEFVCTNEGVEMCRHSTAMRFSAVLSSTTTCGPMIPLTC